MITATSVIIGWYVFLWIAAITVFIVTLRAGHREESRMRGIIPWPSALERRHRKGRNRPSSRSPR